METATGTLTLVEREAEIARLREAVERASSGEGAFVLLEGPAGIGKTGLLEAAGSLAAERGFKVLAARSGELERDFAFGVVRRLFERELTAANAAVRDELLAGSASYAAGAIGLTEPAEPMAEVPDPSSAVLHGLYWLSANLAARDPLLISVDDAHWSDLASLRFVAYLAARALELRLVLLATVRPREPGAPREMVELVRALPECVLLSPSPLSAQGTQTVIAGLLGTDPDESFAAAAHESTGGNPFLLRELAVALRADGATGSAIDARRVHDLGPETVGRSLLLRLAKMPAGATRIAAAVAVLGNDAQIREVTGLADIDEADARRAIDALVEAEILTAEPALNFVHPILRSAVYVDLGPGERSALHGRAARILADRGTDPTVVASHLLHTTPAGEERFVAALRDAATAASRRGAADAAVRYLRRALEEADGPPDGELFYELGVAEYGAGEEPELAEAHLRQAVSMIDDPRSRAAAWLALSRTTMNYIGAPEAVAVLESALADLDGLDRDGRTRLEVELNTLAITHADTYERAAARIDRLAEPPGETTAERLVLCNLAYGGAIAGVSLERTLDLARRGLSEGELIREESLASNAVHHAIFALYLCGHFDEAIAQCDLALADPIARASAWIFVGASGVRGAISYLAGDVPGSEADARQALEAPGCPPFAVPFISTFLVLALIERGELDEAEAVTEGAWPEPELPPILHMEFLLWSRARLRAAQGRHDDALEDLTEYGERCARVGFLSPATPWRADAALACLALGDQRRARRFAAEQLELAERWGAPETVGGALRVKGLVDGGKGGIELAERGVEVLSSSQARLEHARALVDLGAALRRAGRREAARPALRDGLEAARAQGATALVERAHAELVTAGARPRKLMFSGLESLTASERRVAEMAAEGMSNREIAQALFVTTKTVENHLGRAYAKLGIHSRSELPGALAGSG